MMGPLGLSTDALPESFSRRRSRTGSNEGELPQAFSGMMIDDKSTTPSSPKMDTRHFIQIPNKDIPSLWVTLSREQLSSSSGDDDQQRDTYQNNHQKRQQSLFRDLCQTQLSLWTFVVSTLLTYFWQKRLNIRSILFAICSLILATFVSSSLATIVVAAHLFNSDFAASFGGLGDWISGRDDDTKYPQLIRRQSSNYQSKSRKNSAGSGTVSPRGEFKLQQQQRFWQKNMSLLERSYIGSSRS